MSDLNEKSLLASINSICMTHPDFKKSIAASGDYILVTVKCAQYFVKEAQIAAVKILIGEDAIVERVEAYDDCWLVRARRETEGK